MRVCAVTAQMSSFEISHSKTAIHPDEDEGRGSVARTRAVRRIASALYQRVYRCTAKCDVSKFACTRNRVIAVIRYATPARFSGKSALLQTRDAQSSEMERSSLPSLRRLILNK